MKEVIKKLETNGYVNRITGYQLSRDFISLC